MYSEMEVGPGGMGARVLAEGEAMNGGRGGAREVLRNRRPGKVGRIMITTTQ